MLQPHEREVSVMFCDIRGFSKISHKMGATKTIEWCGEVLDVLSECVLREGGVVVDYIGDGLMAMWGAPENHEDHAARACRAGLAILEQMPALNVRWEPILGEKTEIGVGVNTGTAQVGNVGSKRKFKYGALGNTVNLASRVQGATKYFKAKVLITGETQAKLDSSFLTRRLGQVRVVGIKTPVHLHELFAPDWPFACAAQQTYAEALADFERGEFTLAARKLGNWRGECPTDDPVLVLLYRAVRAMVEGTPANHPVWELTEK
jgi:class 3 adenylate cyclase